MSPAPATLAPCSAPSAGMSSRGYHRLAMYQTCPQSFSYRFNLHIESARVADPLALGSLGHIGLMHYYLRRLGRDVLDPFEAMRTQHARIAHQFSRAKDVLEAYMKRYATESLRPLDVEREFCITASGQLHTQRADLVAELGGKVVLIDHKFQARVSNASVTEWEISGQMIGYEVIGRSGILQEMYGLPFGSVIVNFCRTTPPFGALDAFRRAPLSIAPALAASFPPTVHEVNDMIDADAASSRDPWSYRRNYEACVGRYGTCPYTLLCRVGKSALDGAYVCAVDGASDVRKGSGK